MSSTVGVRLLDGPLAGQIREVAAHDGVPGPVLITLKRQPVMFSEADGEVFAVTDNTVTYRIKRSPFRGITEPRWVGAVGEKVGERVRVVLPYSREALAAMGAGERWHIERSAREALECTCAEEGLIPVDVRRVFMGTRTQAEHMLHPIATGGDEIHDVARSIVQAANDIGQSYVTDYLEFSVWQAVAMPVPEPEGEVEARWA